jgi:hypothetical protein
MLKYLILIYPKIFCEYVSSSPQVFAAVGNFVTFEGLHWRWRGARAGASDVRSHGAGGNGIVSRVVHPQAATQRIFVVQRLACSPNLH